jgi:murein L,D-transpeptidase YcbB/YkuD
VPVYWVYITAWAGSDGVVQFRDDIYGKDGFGPAVASSAAQDG